MSYQAGIEQSLARYGLTPCEPHIVCDRCGAIRFLATRTGHTAQWFLRHQAAPGWGLVRTDPESDTRFDLCPVCKESEQ